MPDELPQPQPQSQPPLIFILPTRLDAQVLSNIMKSPLLSLTNDILAAEIIVGKISHRQRALFELRHHHATLDEPDHGRLPGRDRQRVSIVKLGWLTRSLELGSLLDLAEYLICAGLTRPLEPGAPPPLPPPTTTKPPSSLKRKALPIHPSQSPRKRPPLLQQFTTEETESDEEPVPDSVWESLKLPYACQRAAPGNSPNAGFVDELKKMRKIRRLLGDQIGVRAYSTSIAVLSAYPRKLANARQVARLPGCATRISELWQEWQDTGKVWEAGRIEREDGKELGVLNTFCDIWGVGDSTAREFYKKGWRDLDDVVDHFWNNLSRVQQIGIKFYDELRLPIQRGAVEAIANTILKHAQALKPGFQMTIVGGYRRGNNTCHDVDVVLSHPEPGATLFFIEGLVARLEGEKLITHVLMLGAPQSERVKKGQSLRMDGIKHGSQDGASLFMPGLGTGGTGGFDSLDKALVVWQDPSPNPDPDPDPAPAASDNPHQGNPSPHRRVDIIVSPWETVGCAVLGWSGATTFERDLRRWCKADKGLKFDSCGVWNRRDGSWMDLEGATDDRPRAPDMEAAERRVFEGLGLAYRRPEERCTG